MTHPFDALDIIKSLSNESLNKNHDRLGQHVDHLFTEIGNLKQLSYCFQRQALWHIASDYVS